VLRHENAYSSRLLFSTGSATVGKN
jgi:hypothetical protein